LTQASGKALGSCLLFFTFQTSILSAAMVFPLKFDLQDGTHVTVHKESDESFAFFMTRLNSERHNFYLRDGRIEESYETRFDEWQKEAVAYFTSLQQKS